MATRTIPLTSFDRLAAAFFDQPWPRLDRQIPLDVVQRGERLVLHFDLPGVAEDDIDLSVERRVLTVKAERRADVSEGDKVFVAERPFGRMSRQVTLSDTLDLDRVTASFDRGVLTVVIPLSSTAKTRRIEIGHTPVTAEVTSGEPSESGEASEA